MDGARPLAAEDLYGAWKLVSIETTDARGAVLEESLFGKQPEGLILYDRSGWMGVQIQPDPLPPGTAETGARRSSYFAYCGRWAFDVRTQTVKHIIEWATHGRMRGDVLERAVTANGDEVTLSTGPQADAAGARNHLTWRRVP